MEIHCIVPSIVQHTVSQMKPTALEQLIGKGAKRPIRVLRVRKEILTVHCVLPIVQYIAHHSTYCALEVLGPMAAPQLMFVSPRVLNSVTMVANVHNIVKLFVRQMRLSALHL